MNQLPAGMTSKPGQSGLRTQAEMDTSRKGPVVFKLEIKLQANVCIKGQVAEWGDGQEEGGGEQKTLPHGYPLLLTFFRVHSAFLTCCLIF